MSDWNTFRTSWEMWVRTGYQVWPRGQCQEDQDPQWIEDALRMLRYLQIARQRASVPDFVKNALGEMEHNG